MSGIQVSRSPIDYSATHASTAFCTPWPKFSLVNFNNVGAHIDDGQRRHTYGLDSLPAADATIVLQGFADSSESLLVANEIMKMKKELQDDFDLQINAVLLNNCMPLECAKRKSDHATPEWYGGCAPSDELLKAEKWQNLVTKNFQDLVLFQDTKDKLIWNKFGGGKDDLLIYDSHGLLYSYGCSTETCIKGTPGYSAEVDTPLGYQNIKSLLHLAANTEGLSRCQAGSQCSITKQLAPEGLLDNEYVDIAVVAVLVAIGVFLGVTLPKMWTKLQDSLCSTTAIARDRFIQLSTIDNDILEDDEPDSFF